MWSCFALVTIVGALLNSCEAYNAYNANEDNRFEFRMFENFGLTQEIFLKEQAMVAELKSLRSLLAGELQMLRTNLKDIIR